MSLQGQTIRLSPDGMTLTFTALCGGMFGAAQSDGKIQLTYTASAVRAGGMACAMVPLTVKLSTPLGTTPVYDALTGAPLTITRS